MILKGLQGVTAAQLFIMYTSLYKTLLFNLQGSTCDATVLLLYHFKDILQMTDENKLGQLKIAPEGLSTRGTLMPRAPSRGRRGSSTVVLITLDHWILKDHIDLEFFFRKS